MMILVPVDNYYSQLSVDNDYISRNSKLYLNAPKNVLFKIFKKFEIWFGVGDVNHLSLTSKQKKNFSPLFSVPLLSMPIVGAP